MDQFQTAREVTMETLTAEEAETLARLEAKRGPVPIPPPHVESTDGATGERADAPGSDHTLSDELAEMERRGMVHTAALLREFVAIRDKWFPLG